MYGLLAMTTCFVWVSTHKNAWWYLDYNLSICFAKPSSNQTLFFSILGSCLERGCQRCGCAEGYVAVVSIILQKSSHHGFCFLSEVCFGGNLRYLQPLLIIYLVAYYQSAGNLSWQQLFSILVWSVRFLCVCTGLCILLLFHISCRRFKAQRRSILHLYFLRELLLNSSTWSLFKATTPKRHLQSHFFLISTESKLFEYAQISKQLRNAS